jgi:adenylate kinase
VSEADDPHPHAGAVRTRRTSDDTGRRIALTGTPGTGKTTAADRLDVPVVHLNEVIREADLHEGTDPDRDSLYADLDAVATWLDANAPDGDHVVESHLAHLLPADRVVVLRCRPDELERRLRERGESPASARENAESEALDGVLAEAVDEHGADRVYEVDATELSPGVVATAVEAVLAGEREPAVGQVDFTDYLDPATPSATATDAGTDGAWDPDDEGGGG